ncbi:MAG: hypothetical protein JWM41_22 [Gemmatimonadetes bacterium]|nr:hypothetical protein [Gemmatimonadota bacterium]
MRSTFLTLLLAMLPAAVGAQREPAVAHQTLPRDVRREVAERWNGTNALRDSSRVEIAEGREVAGNVAVQHGPLIIAGHVTGSVLALNADVLLRPSARIDGELLVVGGDVDGRTTARVDGAIRIYREAMLYREESGRIVPTDDEISQDENWWRRLEHRHEGNWNEALRVVQAGPYNRVEGLPIELGPALARRTPWGSLRLDAGAIVRTGSSFSSDRGDFGHAIRGEVRVGRNRGIGIGAQAQNVVDPVESWQMSDIEVALASFLARRDYRDYYQRHGGGGFVTLYGARDVSLTSSFGEERWSSRARRNPFTLFNDNREWRENPVVDEGLFHVASTELKFDTRSNPDDPLAGWYLNANFEHGRGTILSGAPTSSDPRAIGHAGVTDYSRGFFDFRRYNRLGPDAQLNMRVVLGGWLNGDPLPLERRLSVDGPGALPGFGFRSVQPGVDVGTCNVGIGAPGRPAECDRIALAQIEYRGDLSIDFTGDWNDWPRHYHSARGDVQWVFFADAGRGWLVGAPTGTLTYDRSTLPSLSTFRSDIGIGLDFAGIGVYCAKAVSTPEPVNFFVRLKHRF